MSEPVPRIRDANPTRLRANFKYHEDHRAGLLGLMEDDPGQLEQTRLGFLSDDYCRLGLIRYALGEGYESVREEFRRAAEAWLRIMELRGTEDPFPVTIITIDITKSPDDPTCSTSRDRYPPGTKDFSNTNSRDALEGVFVALAGGQIELAGKIASLIWDPPDADYIHGKSEVCTYEDQALAYAVRSLLAGDVAGVRRELARIRRVEGPHAFQKGMVLALLDGAPIDFNRSLTRLLAWHDRWARREGPIFYTDYLCFPALGLAALGLARRVFDRDWIACEDPSFPVDLIPPVEG